MLRFETAIGTCAAGWTDRGIARVWLPGPGVPQAPRAATGAPPVAVAAAIDGMVALLTGAPADLRAAPLDLRNVAPFAARVYAIAQAIPPGATLTYGEVAARAGQPGAAQAVGRALGRNPVPILVPCHRVRAAAGDGGFSAPGGVATKRRMLAIEGALGTLFDADALAS